MQIERILDVVMNKELSQHVQMMLEDIWLLAIIN